MIELTDTQLEKQPLEHRRRGGAFDMLARVLRNINTIMFGTGSVINDRPGVKEAGGFTTGFVNSQSVLEIYQEVIPKENNYDFITIGKKATQEKTNTNYIDISVNAKSNEISPANGTVALRLTRDSTQYSNAKIALYEASNYSALGGSNGARTEITGEGTGGGVQLTYVVDGAIVYAFVLDKDGIQLYGLPTSNPGGSNKLWSDGGTLKIT